MKFPFKTVNWWCRHYSGMGWFGVIRGHFVTKNSVEVKRAQ